MDFINCKLPILKSKRNNIYREIIKDKYTFNLNKTPQRLRNILYFNDTEKKDANNQTKITYKSINIKGDNILNKFLHQKIFIKKNLKPIKTLRKNNSEINIKDNGIQDKNSLTLLLFKKYDKNYNSLKLKQISRIDKALLKENENDTNGNVIYENHDEEKKESMISIINNKNIKEFIKKRLTKNISEKTDKKDNCKIDDFKFFQKKFESPRIKNIRRIKFIQDTIRQKNSCENNCYDKDKLEKNNHINQYNSFLKGKFKGMEDEINNNGKDLKIMNQLLDECMNNARQQFDDDIKNIFGEDF